MRRIHRRRPHRSHGPRRRHGRGGTGIRPRPTARANKSASRRCLAAAPTAGRASVRTPIIRNPVHRSQRRRCAGYLSALTRHPKEADLQFLPCKSASCGCLAASAVAPRTSPFRSMYGVTNNRRPADVILSATTLRICAVYTADGRTVATGRAAGTAAGALASAHVQQLAPINQPPADASPRRRRPDARP